MTDLRNQEVEHLLDKEAVARTIRRLASSIVEQAAHAKGGNSVAIIGIRRGGVGLAARLATEITALEPNLTPPLGSIDISFYRDDAATALPDPKVGPSHVPFDVDGRDIIIVDDVLQTARTVRAAVECLHDYGRPRRIWLAVLIDRDGRELPIAADFVGRLVPAGPHARIDVTVAERPSETDGVWLQRGTQPTRGAV